MINTTTLQLLRFHFSLFLMPVYLFALSQVADPAPGRAVLVFIILHVLVYPASNGYNSYMDRDEGPIGGLEHPPRPAKQLFVVTLGMDLLALLLGAFISAWFFGLLLAYILASRAYSYRKIRIKKYPVVGYLTVILFQGAVIYALVYHGCSSSLSRDADPLALMASSLLIGGVYPLTQVYQHEADRMDGVRSISMMLGYRGTFVFAGIIYAVALFTLSLYFRGREDDIKFWTVAAIMSPVIIYFFTWLGKVWRDTRSADFRHSMRMNWWASLCSNLAFLTILIWSWIE